MSISPLILISEFVIVDHGKYIVRVSALSNNVVVGTGLAGADTVEKAEDEARKRAIEVIDWANNFTPQIINQNTSSSSFTQKEQKLSSPINTPSITAQEQINNINTSAASTAETPKTTSSIRPPVIPQNDSQKTPTLNLNSKPEAIENKEEKTKTSLYRFRKEIENFYWKNSNLNRVVSYNQLILYGFVWRAYIPKEGRLGRGQ